MNHPFIRILHQNRNIMHIKIRPLRISTLFIATILLLVVGQVDCFSTPNPKASSLQSITSLCIHSTCQSGSGRTSHLLLRSIERGRIPRRMMIMMAPSNNDAFSVHVVSSSSSSQNKNLFFCNEDILSTTTATIASNIALTNQKDKATNITKVASPSSPSFTTFSIHEFAQQHPFINNVAIATIKTGSADLMSQTIFGDTSIFDLDLERLLLFMLFGGLYSGCFQWVYQVQVFQRLFDVDKFTNLSWKEKVEDKEGIQQLIIQTALDLTVMTFVYLPTFYVFKAGVFSGSPDPSVWASTGIENYGMNFAKDEVTALRVWFPADLVCFSVPLYLRLPVRHAISFLWTIYLSSSRGGH